VGKTGKRRIFSAGKGGVRNEKKKGKTTCECDKKVERRPEIAAANGWAAQVRQTRHGGTTIKKIIADRVKTPAVVREKTPGNWLNFAESKRVGAMLHQRRSHVSKDGRGNEPVHNQKEQTAVKKWKRCGKEIGACGKENKDEMTLAIGNCAGRIAENSWDRDC